MKTYLVGGAIRDSLLKIPVKDKDWLIVGATPEQMLQKGFKPVGKDFPVFLHPVSGEQYALARIERKSGSGYTGFICHTAGITLEQDLSRRDLTINAMAYDENGKIYDPFKGYEDLHKRQLRHVSSHFNEDPLRVLRVARFAACYAHLNFRIVPETLALMRSMSDNGELKQLSAERIWKETELALQSRNPQRYFQILRECNALAVIFPELNNLYGIRNNQTWPAEMDLAIHTLMSLSIAAQLSNQLEVRFATLCHDFGQDLIHNEKFTNSPRYTIKLIDNLCQRLRIPKNLRDLAVLAAKFHNLVQNIDKLETNTVVNLFNKIDAWRKIYRIEQIAIISEADARGCIGLEKISYHQTNQLRTIFNIACEVSVRDIINMGFRGAEINKELYYRRCQAIKNWQFYKKI
ncbi:MAG: multifunctional CCA addition/repair protein [Candidatus Dasytiphilus stammeri]